MSAAARTWIGLAVVVSCLQLCPVSSQDARRLFEDLLYRSNYNPVHRPSTSNITTSVSLSVALINIPNIDLATKELTLILWTTTTWYDHRLRWDPESYGGIVALPAPESSVWRPGVVVVNQASPAEMTIPKEDVLMSVTNAGRVSHTIPMRHRVLCGNLTDLKSDSGATCDIRFGSWSYGKDDVEVRFDPQHGERMDLSWYVESPRYEVVGNTASLNDLELSTGTHSGLVYSLAIRAKSDSPYNNRPSNGASGCHSWSNSYLPLYVGYTIIILMMPILI